MVNKSTFQLLFFVLFRLLTIIASSPACNHPKPLGRQKKAGKSSAGGDVLWATPTKWRATRLDNGFVRRLALEKELGSVNEILGKLNGT